MILPLLAASLQERKTMKKKLRINSEFFNINIFKNNYSIMSNIITSNTLEFAIF